MLELLCDGLTTAEIARRLFVSKITVRRHVSILTRKLGVSGREHLVALAGAAFGRRAEREHDEFQLWLGTGSTIAGVAYLASRIRGLPTLDADREVAVEIMESVQLALDESRGAISALGRPMSEPLHVALARTAEEIAGRLGAELELDIDERVSVPPAWEDALPRIVREAVAARGFEVVGEAPNGEAGDPGRRGVEAGRLDLKMPDEPPHGKIARARQPRAPRGEAHPGHVDRCAGETSSIWWRAD